MNKKFREFGADFALFVVAVLWGVTFLPMAEALKTNGVFTILFWRFLLSFVLMSLISLKFLPRREPKTAKNSGCRSGKDDADTTAQSGSLGLANERRALNKSNSPQNLNQDDAYTAPSQCQGGSSQAVDSSLTQSQACLGQNLAASMDEQSALRGGQAEIFIVQVEQNGTSQACQNDKFSTESGGRNEMQSVLNQNGKDSQNHVDKAKFSGEDLIGSEQDGVGSNLACIKADGKPYEQILTARTTQSQKCGAGDKFDQNSAAQKNTKSNSARQAKGARPLFPYKIDSNSLKYGAILGILLFCGFAPQTFALKYTFSSTVAFITGLNVVFVPFIALLFLRQKVYIYAFIGAFLSAFGLYLLSAGELGFGLGEALSVVCALGYALHIIFTGVFVRRCELYAMVCAQFGTVALLCLTAAFFYEPNFIKPVLNTAFYKAVIITAVFATVFAFFVQSAMQRYTTPMKTALIFTFEPVSAGLLGYFVGGEILSSAQIFGACLILAGIITSEVGSYLKSRAA